MGGIAGAALVTTLASQGAQYLGIYLYAARRRRRQPQRAGRRCSINIVLAALGTAGIPGAREAFLVVGLRVSARCFFGVGLLSDLRSIFAPKGGIGMFFGTFNPFHNTHLAIMRRAMEERGLDKIIIHPTLIPRLHVEAFRKGEIRVGRLEDGFQIYEKTDKADVNVDYFPTGNMFLPPETRKALIELARRRSGPRQTRSRSRSLRETYDTQAASRA